MLYNYYFIFDNEQQAKDFMFEYSSDIINYAIYMSQAYDLVETDELDETGHHIFNMVYKDEWLVDLISRHKLSFDEGIIQRQVFPQTPNTAYF